MTVYAYVRVSTIQQANDGDSLVAQVKQVLDYASSQGLDLKETDFFVEKGVSGGQEFTHVQKVLGFLLVSTLVISLFFQSWIVALGVQGTLLTSFTRLRKRAFQFTHST